MPDLKGTIMMACRLSKKRWPHEIHDLCFTLFSFACLFVCSFVGKRGSFYNSPSYNRTDHVVQADLEVTEIRLPLFISVGIKGVLTSNYPVHFYLCSNATDLIAIY